MSMYFVAIVAPDDLNAKVLEWKNYMFENFGCKVALRSPAHITLIPPFNMSGTREAELIEQLGEFSASQRPFAITLKDFSSFPPRVIFVGVETSAELENIKSELEHFLATKGYPIKKDARPFHPHVTIANRDLDRKDFKTAWEHFKPLKYRAQFNADAICVLRSEKEGWSVIHKEFLPD